MYTLIKQENVKGFDIQFSVDEDIFFDPSDLFSEKEDIDVCRDKLESGEWLVFTARITASKCGIVLAEDYLDGCVYSNPIEFWNKDEDYCSEMIDNVIKQAIAVLKILQNETI